LRYRSTGRPRRELKARLYFAVYVRSRPVPSREVDGTFDCQHPHVMPKRCGESCSMRGEDDVLNLNRRLSLAGGSCSSTSSAAPAIHPSVKALISAGSSTTGPREVLIKSADRFILRNWGSPIRCRVSLVSGQCTESTSDSEQTCSKLACCTPAFAISSAGTNGSNTMIFGSKPASLRATARAILPKLTSPTVRPAN
jgi:hypothetical protein